MTTPAQNIDAGLATDGSVFVTWYVTSTGEVWIPRHQSASGKTVTQWRAYQRPASQTNGRADSSGWRPPLPYSFTREVSAFHASPVTEIQFSGPFTIVTEYYDGFGSTWREQRPTFYDSDIIDRAVSAALLKLKNQQVNFGVAFGEYKETAELVASTVHRIAKGVSAFRGAHPREWGQVVKSQLGRAATPNKNGGRGSGIPNSWLELQYGWNPAMQDVSAACSVLSDDASGGHPFRIHVKGRAKSSLNGVSWGKCTEHSGSGLQLVRSGHNFAYVRLDYELDSPLLAVFSSLGLTNPLEIAWELVPYSFVVDWFLPIGDWLRTLDADFGWRFLGGSLTQGYKYVTEGNGVILLPGQGLDGSTGYCQSRQDVLSFARSTYDSSPRAGFPTVKNPLSVGHVANALSLLVNAFR